MAREKERETEIKIKDELTGIREELARCYYCGIRM